MDQRHDVLSVARTRIQYAERVSRAVQSDVFVKRDDETHAAYGGNKIRKLAHLLVDARTRGATDLVTLGAVGSHHVLATTVHGRAMGFSVHAVLVPQPKTPHVEEMVKADLAQGAHLVAARAEWELPAKIASLWFSLRALGRRPYFISLGGSSPRGAVGYIDAMRELRDQHASGELPSWPDAIICAFGSGGTLAGILAGARMFGVPSQAVGVRVTAPLLISKRFVSWMANRAAHLAEATTHIHPRDVHIDHSQIGAGYGHSTRAGQEATDLFGEDGLTLDSTYTAKTAAALIARARKQRGGNLLYWHTLSSAAMEPLISQSGEIPSSLAGLLL